MILTPESRAITPIWELASVSSESIAFFLVTIDLYGEERLAALNDRLLLLLNRIRPTLWWLNRLFHWSDDRLGSPVLFIIRCAMAATSGYGALAAERASVGHDLITTATAYIVATVLGGLCFYLLGTIGLDVALALPLFPLWLLRRVRLKGVLLVTGSMLFVIAKSIVIFHLLKDLHFQLKLPFL